MLETNIMQSLKSHLFAWKEMNVYAVLDGASVHDLPGNLARFDSEHVCLYRGELAPDILHVAPHLVRLERDAPITDWLLSNGWGNHWGIFAVSSLDLNALRRHFRTFLMVYGPDGESLYFRYYDPRVLRIYLSTCNAEELKKVFGPVRTYLVEDHEPKRVRKFSLFEGVMREDGITLG